MVNKRNDADYRFLEKLSEANGPSGFEQQVVMVVSEYVRPFADDLFTDKMGSLVFSIDGPKIGPTIMLASHMDEIGFVVTTVTNEGYLGFSNLGFWSEYTLSGQRVQVMTKGGLVNGVIVSLPPYVQDPKAPKTGTAEPMFIDIGCSNKDEVRAMGIRLGDAVVPASRFSTVEKARFVEGKRQGTRTLVFGKALDDRAGVFLTTELFRTISEKKVKHPNRLVGAATVQEEVGSRGAHTAARMVKPDVALILDVDVAGDVPGVSPSVAPTKMGEGVSITVWDANMIPNQPLKELCIDLCEDNGIPYQLSQSKGGTDADAIHMSGIGVPSIVLGPPVRHIHTHVGIMDLGDVDATLRLLTELAKALDRKTVDSLTSIGGLRCGR